MANNGWLDGFFEFLGKAASPVILTGMSTFGAVSIDGIVNAAYAQEARSQQNASFNINREEKQLCVEAGPNGEIKTFLFLVKVPKGASLDSIVLELPNGERSFDLSRYDEEFGKSIIRNEIYMRMQLEKTIGGGLNFMDPLGQYLWLGRHVMTAKGAFSWVFLRPGEIIYSVLTQSILKDAGKAIALAVVKDIIDHPQDACLDIAKKYYEECRRAYRINRKIRENIDKFETLTATEAIIFSDNLDFIETYIVAANRLSNNIQERKELSETVKEKAIEKLNEWAGRKEEEKSDLKRIFEEASMLLEEYPPYKTFVQEVMERQRAIGERKRRFAELMNDSSHDLYTLYLSIKPLVRRFNVILPDKTADILAHANGTINGRPFYKSQIINVGLGEGSKVPEKEPEIPKPKPEPKPEPKVSGQWDQWVHIHEGDTDCYKVEVEKITGYTLDRQPFHGPSLMFRGSVIAMFPDLKKHLQSTDIIGPENGILEMLGLGRVEEGKLIYYAIVDEDCRKYFRDDLNIAWCEETNTQDLVINFKKFDFNYRKIGGVYIDRIVFTNQWGAERWRKGVVILGNIEKDEGLKMRGNKTGLISSITYE